MHKVYSQCSGHQVEKVNERRTSTKETTPFAALVLE